jgi:hypothetical protein
MTCEELRRRAPRLPRLSLTHLPNPLEYCTRLTAALANRAEIYLNRDDLTTIGLGVLLPVRNRFRSHWGMTETFACNHEIWAGVQERELPQNA